MIHSRAVLLLLCAIATTARADEPVDFQLIIQPNAYATLVNPQCSHCRDEAGRRAGQLQDDDRILAWTRGKYDGGGIPYRFFLVPYRVISDTYGVFVYDPDAGFARGFEPSLDFTFHGWRKGVMVMKHKDGTLYSTLSGRAFAGPRAGDRLKPIATITTDWGYWRAAYPGSVAYKMLDKYQPLEIPDAPSEDSLRSRAPLDMRLPADEKVLGVEIDGKMRAYRVSDLKKTGGVLADRLAGQDVFVLWYAPTRSAAVYSPSIEESSPVVHVSLGVDAKHEAAPFVDRHTKSHFGIEGRAHDGPLEGKALRWIDSIQCRWFAWAAEHPQTEIYTPERADVPAKAQRHSPRRLGKTREAVLVTPDRVTPATARQWRRDGFEAIVSVLAEPFESAVYERVREVADTEQLELYYWLEVARNPSLAEAHPEWMASLGAHEDWRRSFPGLRQIDGQEVVKAYPWVPIGYRDAFAAHLQRVRDLLARVPDRYTGLLVNDLQGGPSSCGCGNLQCRWAIDYRVPQTAAPVAGNDVAARWLARVKSMVGDKQVIPVWTTECEEIDLPPAKAPSGKSTGLCGSVPCAAGTCPIAFSKQWRALCESHSGGIGMLLTEKQLDRQGPPYGPAGAWIAQGLAYLERVPAMHGAPTVDRARLWLIVDGDRQNQEAEAHRRRVAAQADAGMVVVARTRLDQSYEPRIVRATPGATNGAP